jgi:hypothetical protein
VVLGSVEEGKVEHMPSVASLIPGAEVPIPKEGRLQVLGSSGSGFPEDL